MTGEERLVGSLVESKELLAVAISLIAKVRAEKLHWMRPEFLRRLEDQENRLIDIRNCILPNEGERK